MLVGIDVGTTGSKAIVTDSEGHILGSGYKEYTCTYPNPNWVEQKASDLMTGAFTACSEAIKASGVTPSDIKAISFSAQRATFGLMDNSNNIINDCLYVWQDNRAASIMGELQEKMDPVKLYNIGGQPVTPTFTLEKLLWIQKYQPELLEKTKTLIMIPGLAAYAFGADELTADQANACCSSLLDIHTGTWSTEIITTYGLDKNIFPEVVKPGTVIGKVSAKAAKASGLSEGTLIVSGSGDNQCGALGAGVTKEGEASMSLGTSGVLVVGTEKPLLKDDMALMVANALVENLYEAEAIQLGAASSYRWLRDTLCQSEVTRGQAINQDPFTLMEEHVVKSPPGANGTVFLPYLSGAGYPTWESSFAGSFHGIRFNTTRSDMVRSVMEGITLESKDMYESLKDSGVKIDVLTIIGGATKSPTWRQMIADMFKTNVRTLQNPDATLLGAVILAGYGAGTYHSLSEGVERIVRFSEIIEPCSNRSAIYDQVYQNFKNYSPNI